MIKIEEVLIIHEILIKEFGGSHGIRDRTVLDSAINRPFQSFNQRELYPTPKEKAAAILESIVKNHPFIDGNKRTGYVLMRLILLESGMDLKATEEEKYKFVIEVANGDIDFEQIKEWIKNKTNSTVSNNH